MNQFARLTVHETIQRRLEGDPRTAFSLQPYTYPLPGSSADRWGALKGDIFDASDAFEQGSNNGFPSL